jgi:hypothetical protein
LTQNGLPTAKRYCRAVLASVLLFLPGRALAQQDFRQLAIPGHGIGDLRLTKDTASFSGLHGKLKIRYVGVLSNGSLSDFAGSRIFRILNGRHFFALNKGNDVCHKPPTWLGVSPADKIGSIWLTLFQIDDYRYYRADKSGLCIAAVYTLKR